MTYKLTGLENDHYLPASAEMRNFDEKTIAAGTSSPELMERVAKQVIVRLEEMYPQKLDAGILVLAGPGNNGGDGVAIARLLKLKSIRAELLLVGSGKLSSDCRAQITKFGKDFNTFGFSLDDAQELQVPDILRLLDNTELVIDCLLGTGQSQAPRGPIAEVVSLLKELETPIISVDVPTGIDTDTGAVYEPHVTASTTYTVQFLKRGCVQYPAYPVCGEIIALDVGIKATHAAEFSILSASDLNYFRRMNDAHKGNYGAVLVLAGSKDMPGAAKLAAAAAHLAGAGQVKKFELTSFDKSSTPLETMFIHSNQADNCFNLACLQEIQPSLKDIDGIVLGPGLSQTDSVKEFVTGILPFVDNRFVLDADFLNIIAKLKDVNLNQAVITPHPGEAARLLGCSIDEVQSDRYQAAKDLAKKYNAIVVLKGVHTIIYSESHGYVNFLGNPYMATPGSGDVLAGVIAALRAQGFSAIDSAKVGVFTHATAGDLAHERTGATISASMIIEMLPYALGSLLDESFWSRRT